MLIKFKNARGRGVRNPIRWGDGDDVHVAVCSLYAFKIYEQTFMEDPFSRHHSLANDVMDTGDGGDGTFWSFMGIDWDADARAMWAMLKAGDVTGDNDAVGPTPSYDELLEAHAGDNIDVSLLHACVVSEIEATFPSLSARLAKAARKLEQAEREQRAD